jgi:hypothetical protein
MKAFRAHILANLPTIIGLSCAIIFAGLLYFLYD